MEELYLQFIRDLSIETITYDVAPLRYCNPHSKTKPELKTLKEMGFPHDVKKSPQYYNYSLLNEFFNKTRSHWKRKLPPFKDNFLKYLLVTKNTEQALELFFEDCEAYGVSKEEAQNYLCDRMTYYLEPSDALEAVKEFIYIIIEYAPNNFDYFCSCFGLKNSFCYRELYESAEDILKTATGADICTFTPRIIKREILKGTALIDIYKNVFDNKSKIKETLKSMDEQDWACSALSKYQRQIEKILLTQSRLDYTLCETIEGIRFDYTIYENGSFLFAIKYDEQNIYYEDFHVQLQQVQKFDALCLKKEIPVYHIADICLFDEELEPEVTFEIRAGRKDPDYFLQMMLNGTQYRYLKEYFREEFGEEDEDFDCEDYESTIASSDTSHIDADTCQPPQTRKQNDTLQFECSGVSGNSPWLFIEANCASKEDIAPFWEMINRLAYLFEDEPIETGDYQYRFPKDSNRFTYQWDDLFGIVIAYTGGLDTAQKKAQTLLSKINAIALKK